MHASACYETSGGDGGGPSGGSAGSDAGAGNGGSAGKAGASATGGSTNEDGGTTGSGATGTEAGATSVGEAGTAGSAGEGASGGSAGAGGATAGTGANAGTSGASGAGGSSGAGASGPGDLVGIGGQLSVSSGFYLHEPRAIVPATEFVGGAMACSASGCLVAYGQEIGGRWMVLASRVSATGAVLDKIVLTTLDDVNAEVWAVRVAAGDDEFLVHAETRETQNGASQPRYYFHVVGDDGTVRATSTSLFTTAESNTIFVYGGGENFLVRYAGGATNLQLLSPELEPVGAAVNDGYTVSPPPSITFGPGGYLIANGRYAGCVSDTNLSTPGFQGYWQYGDPTSLGPLIATDSGYVLLGTRNSETFTRDTYAVRFNEACGLLDGDDDFNQLSGGVLLCEDCGGTIETAAWLGSYGLASVRQSGGVGLFRFGLDPLARIGGVLHAELEWTDHAPSRLFALGGELLGLDRAKVLRLGGAGDPFELGVESEAIAVPFSGDIEGASVAFAGSRFLVAGSNMRPTFVGTDGALEPVAGIAADSGGQVADDGTDFMLTQQAAGQVTARRISPSGELGEAHTLAYSTSAYNFDFRLTSTDDTYLLTALNSSDVSAHAVSGIRIAADGSYLDEGREIFRFNSGIYGVLGDSFPQAEYRSYGVFGMQGSTLEWLRVRSQSGSIIAPAKWLPATYAPAFASDGYQFLVAYQAPDGGVLGAYAALLYPDSGDPRVEPKPIAGIASGYVRGAWYDGLVFYVGRIEGDLARSDPHTRFSVRRFDRELAELDSATLDGYAIVPDKFHPYMTEAPALGSDGDGLSLMAYQYADPVYGGVTLKGVFLKNDMARPTFPPASCEEMDFLDFGGELFEEGADSGDGTPVCDPVLFGYATDSTAIVLRWNFVPGDPFDPAAGGHASSMEIFMHGPPPTSFPAVYDVATSGGTPGTVTIYMNTAIGRTCLPETGTVTLTAIGPVGSQIQGSFAFETFSGVDCPSGARSGTFGVTRTD